MALVEIEDALLGQLGVAYADRGAEWKRAREHEQFFQKVAGGKNRAKLMHLLKEEFPDLAIPEIDAAAPVMGEVEKVRKEFEEYKAAQEAKAEEAAKAAKERDAGRAIEDGRRWLRQQGFDDEGIKKVEELMQQRGVADYEIAASHVRATMPQPEPLPSSSGYAGRDLGAEWFSKPDDSEPDRKLLMANPRKFSAVEAAKALKEFAEQRRRGARAA